MKPFADNHTITYASDFTGMDCAAYAIKMLHPAINLDIAWMSDNDKRNREFLIRNYPKVFQQNRFYDDVTKRKINQKWYRKNRHICCGPTLPGFLLGRCQKDVTGQRSSLYEYAVQVNINIQPKIAIIENSSNIYNANRGVPLQHIVERITNSGYVVEQEIMNTIHQGLPHNRNRLYLICIRQDNITRAYKSPLRIPYIQTEQLRIPIEREVTNWINLPAPKDSKKQVLQAQNNIPHALIDKDAFLAEHCSSNFQPHPKPTPHIPALTSSKRTGHWMMKRGRAFKPSEAARLQGYLSKIIIWHYDESHNFHMLSNTMSVPVIQRLLISALAAINIKVEDPWTGKARFQLIQEATEDRLSLEQRHKLQIQETQSIAYRKQHHVIPFQPPHKDTVTPPQTWGGEHIQRRSTESPST